MAGITSRSVARLITSISTTPTLRGSSSTRTISSFKGLQSLAEPGRVSYGAYSHRKYMAEHVWIYLLIRNGNITVENIIRRPIPSLLGDYSDGID